MHLAMAAANYASGLMLDIGRGAKENELLFSPHVRRHIGLGHPASPHRHFAKIDIFGLDQALPFPASSFDTTVCTAVLEHVEEPLRALHEAHRVLGPGGHAIYTGTPLLACA